MPRKQSEPTQYTQPAKGEPIEIPVPTRDEIDQALAKIAQPLPPKPKKGKSRHKRTGGR